MFDPNGGFQEGWTVFYWTWWVAYAPVIGLFVARISRGRTIPQVIFGELVYGKPGVLVFFAVWGGYAIHVKTAGTLDVAVPSTGPLGFDPCEGCDAPCRRACPQGAFNNQIYKTEDYGQKRLPGRIGVYSRPVCKIQMELDNDMAKEQIVEGFDEPVKIIKHCRKCELSCPVGR